MYEKRKHALKLCQTSPHAGLRPSLDLELLDLSWGRVPSMRKCLPFGISRLADTQPDIKKGTQSVLSGGIPLKSKKDP